MSREAESRSPIRPARGLTMVETLIALAIAGFLMLALQRLLAQTLATQRAVDRNIDGRDLENAALELLAADLTNLPAGGEIHLRENVLEFIGLSALHAQTLGARHAVRIRYRCGGDAGAASREWHRDEKELAATQYVAGAVLAERLTAATFEVFDGRRWQAEWPPATPVPALAIRVRLAYEGGSHIHRIIRLAPLRWSRHDE